MTLFRKVFQNQARPADTPDEDALRDALLEASGAEEGERPDPFVLSDQVEALPDAAEFAEDEEAGYEHDDEAPEDPVEAAATEESDGDVCDDAQGAPDESEFVLPGDEETGNALVEGILAAARDKTAEYEPNTPAATPFMPEVGALDTRDDLTGDTGAGEFDAQSETESDPVALPPETAVGGLRDTPPASDADTSSLPEPADVAATDAVAPEAAHEEEIDLSAFARDQLTALGGQGGPAATGEAPAGTDAGLSAPAAGRAGRRAGRVKTRLLGFNRGGADHADPIGGALEATASQQQEKFPVGWLVVVEGPGVGHSFSIFTGASMIGRGEDQVIRLDFGDNSISRQNHAAIAYDDEQNKFYIGHGGKSNIIRRNARPVLSTEELQHADLIRIGETTLRFVALCGSDFKWDAVDTGNDAAV
ncbi:FHA domain-containing protein [Roseobacter ponti]|nr:FHA domain-containing protein [Roseobacter ponti]